MDIYKRAQELESYVVDIRRHIHQNPELSGEEVQTIAYIAGKLDEIGIDYVVVENGGIIATIEGAKPGRTVMLRADVDALPIQEPEENLKGKRTCVSQNPGAMHACGHDGHTAMLLGAGKILFEMKDELAGRVLLFFERGEEATGNIVYLLKYVAQQGIHIDAVWGIHLLATLQSGKISIKPGPVMAGGVGFDVTIKGKGGHGSRPDMANNPLDCFNAIYTAIQSIRLKNITPYETLTVSVGLVEGANKANIIPDTIRFSGSARVFDKELCGWPFYHAFKRIVENICAAYDCEYTYNMITEPTLGVINNEACCKLAESAITKVLGAEYIQNVEPWMASESMSLYLNLWPGCFAFVGIENEEKGIGAAHHHPAFDLDEDVLKYGVASGVAYALEVLNSAEPLPVFKGKDGIRDLLLSWGIMSVEKRQELVQDIE